MDILQTFIILHNDAVKRDMDFLAIVYTNSIRRIMQERYAREWKEYKNE